MDRAQLNMQGEWPNAIVSLGCLGLLMILVSSLGCHRFGKHIGPQTIMEDRLPYNNAVADSWKEQTLLNIVKLRYVETPFFLDVPQVISGYSLDHSANASLGLQNAANVNIPGSERFLGIFGFTTRFSDRPTVSYSPQTSSQFIRNLTTPLPPIAVLSLLQSGYSADAVFGLSVQSLNGFRNRSATGGTFHPADPEFLWAIEALDRAQNNGSFGIRIDRQTADDETVKIQVGQARGDQLDDERIWMRELLGLDVDATEFSVIYGNTPRQPDQIAIKTQPIYMVLRDLSPFVEVPLADLAAGRALPYDISCVENPPLIVECGCEPPPDCFVAIPYRDCWFWIDHGHLESKRTFNYLSVLLALADTGPKQAKPTVTIQAN